MIASADPSRTAPASRGRAPGSNVSGQPAPATSSPRASNPRVRLRRRTPSDGRMTVVEHLDEFRYRVLVSLAAFAACTIVAYLLYRPILELLTRPLDEASRIAARDLQSIGILRPGEGKGVFLARVRYAYPVYDLTYKENLERLKQFVKPFENLDTTGRQGLYRYNNMDHSIAMGRKMARGLIRGVDAGAHAVATGEEYFG